MTTNSKKYGILVGLLLGAAGLASGSNVLNFQVDMSPQINDTSFNPLTDHVYVRGTFNGFPASASDGLVLTNAHVVENATNLSVTLSDGTKYSATIVGSDATRDIALVQIQGASNLPAATLGSSDALQVGDGVVAIGNALDLDGSLTVTSGIVSAKERSLDNGDGSTLGHLIQTDAAINSGNSGGPLLNMAGEVVGINTAIIQDSQNLGFSISIDSVKPLITSLQK